MSKSVLFFAEQSNGQFRKSAFEVATAGRQVADALGGELVAAVVGDAIADSATTLGAYGVDKVIAAENTDFHYYSPEGFTQALIDIITELEPGVVLFPATSLGSDLAPRVAAKLGVGLASDCTELFVVDGKLEIKRPIYAGKAYIRVAFNSEPQMATLRSNVFSAQKQQEGKEAAVEKIQVNVAEGKSKSSVKEFRPMGGDRIELTEADIIVSGGRGMREPGNFAILEELAKELGAAVGASRAAVDAGWRPHSDQVGQTGKTVSPNLYIAVGISGAIQHLAGMSSSKYIVAINKDPEAPIFKKADYGIVGDLFEIVPALTEEVRKLKSS